MPNEFPKPITDLKQYLNDTKEEHNNFGYDEFVRMIENVSMAAMARTFQVNQYTIKRWIDIYEKEQSNV